MLVSITDKCRMGCSHCMDDAKECNNNFMSFQTFKDALDFNFKYDPSIVITGGEPTEHPQFWSFIDYLVDILKTDPLFVATITTNGMNLVKNAEAEAKIEEYSRTVKNLVFQVTNDVRYYPIRINSYERIFKHPNVVYIERLASLYPQGRAGNKHSENITAPKCFNIISASRSVGFKGAVSALRIKQKFCTPQIGFDGSLKLGESTLCPKIATIHDSYETINKAAQSFVCHGCDILTENLKPEYKRAIGR